MSEIDINYQKGYTKGFIDGESKYLDFIVKQEQLRKPDPIILKCSEFEKCPLKEEKQQREQEWIPVSERLPKWGQKCLVVLKTRNSVTTDIFRGLRKEGDWSYVFNEVTHWMPLPEPPEKEVKP